jgi:hypothetical protein
MKKSNLIKIIFLNLFFLTSLFASFETDIEELKTKSFKKKQQVINELVEKYSDDERTETLLKKMVDGDLFYTKKEGTFVILEKKEGSTYYTKTFLD